MLVPNTAYRLNIEAQSHLSNINAYYDSPAIQLFEKFAQQQIHLGYWDDKYPHVSLEQAAMRLTQVVVDFVGLPREGHFLDIGCGCGLPSIEVARQKQCYVDGVTINPLQKQKADALAKAKKMKARVSFRVADANALPYRDNAFDCAMFLESIHHIGHVQALREAHRVLKPGGEIVIADGAAIRDGASSNDKERLGEIFVSKSLVTASQLEQLMLETGFEVSDTVDLTSAVMPTWQKLMDETEQNRAYIIRSEGLEFFDNLMTFWADMKYLWRSNAQYLLYKGIKRDQNKMPNKK